jgi:hypothetical protein
MTFKRTSAIPGTPGRGFKRRAIFVAFLAALPLAICAFACTSSSVAPACNALAACCESPNDPDPSSCSETAMSGQLDEAGCGAQLATYQSNGTGPVDAGATPSGDATRD